ncbi:MAG TPA: threonine synthase [Rhodocyclaceae bacterium]|nr:threonine synthase [Rhodocyclaceae bacterium]
MRYISTRGQSAPRQFLDILLGGLMPDGGLAMPERYPQLSGEQIERWRSLDYRELAYAVLSVFIDDMPGPELAALIDRTYTPEVFRHARPGDDPSAITPLHALEPDLHLLCLSNGPTLAFKDMAMQLLGNLFEHVLAARGACLNILGATSGDTGSSAEWALAGKRGIRVFMLSPLGKMSRFQAAQMYSLADANIHNLAVRGVFDQCQDIVKTISADPDFKARHHIGAVNSINWARVAAQVVYYFKAYFAATRGAGEEVSFSVPSGNFGNVCAGHIARMMGLPIRRLIVATNENDVLSEFFSSGVYRPRTALETRQTSSPSMDISKASNFERFVFDLVGRDPVRVRTLWAEVDSGSGFDLGASGEFRNVGDFGFVAGTSRHADRLRMMREIWERHQGLIATHTADGLVVGLAYREPGVPLICLETAQAIKFEDTVREALGFVPTRPTEFSGLEDSPQRYQVIDADIGAVKAFIAQHDSSW